MSVHNNKKGLFPIAGTDNPDRLLDVLLLHGLGGDAISTWQYEDKPHYFWPKALWSDCADIAVWTIGYGASASGWIDDVMSMEDRAENLLNQLSLQGIGKKPFALITHSMGGLMAKYMLTQAAQSNQAAYQAMAQNCQGIVFLAVPHNGSGWSDILDYARILVRGNSLLKQLAKDSSALRQLDKNFRQLSERLNLSCYAFFETKQVRIQKRLLGLVPISTGIQVVSESSASSSVLTEPAIPLDDDHLSICKLRSKQDQLYGNLVRIIQLFLNKQPVIDTSKNALSYAEEITKNITNTDMNNTVQAKIHALKSASIQKRLESLLNQLDALQSTYDLETRMEEKMRLEVLIQHKQATIDSLTS